MPENALLSLGQRIQWVRKRSGLNQDDFPRQFDIGKRTLAYYEADNRIPDAVLCASIAQFCNVPVHCLLTGEGSPDSAQNAQTPPGVADGSDSNQKGLKGRSGGFDIDGGKSNRVLSPDSKQLQEEPMSGERLLRYVEFLENENAELKQRVKYLEGRGKKREAAGG